jgi:DNA modification methylase
LVEFRSFELDATLRLSCFFVNYFFQDFFALGSGSIAIACHYAKLRLTACEIDPDYFRATCERIARETSQTEFNL